MLMAVQAFAGSSAVVGSKHDLGLTGGGSITSDVEDSCLFCHAPHNVLATVTPLWDQQLSIQTYTTYTSSTYNSGLQTPSAGSSKLCLSCHDGTIAPGMTIAQGPIPTMGTMSSRDVLGTNLAFDHPVSMAPASDGQLAASLFGVPPLTKDAAVKLVAGKVECVTCHDPHDPGIDPVVPMFLVRSNDHGMLCLACHDPSLPQPNQLHGWDTGSHSTATNAIYALDSNPDMYGTVAGNACSSCHGAHQNAAGERNLKAVEEAACSYCHGLPLFVVPQIPDVLSEFSKPYSHPTTAVTGIHDAAESLPVSNGRHAECPDCHNSHAASAQIGTAVPPALPDNLAGVSGYDTGGAQKPATREYQVCFKCHADSPNKPQNSTYQVYGRTPSRYPQGTMPAGFPVSPPTPSDQYNVRLQFMSSIGHNVMGFSTVTTPNTTLRPYMLNLDGTNNEDRPLTTASQLYCSDCHNNEDSRSFAGAGPNGPHASSYPHILQLNLYQEPASGGSGNNASGYDLCRKCHDLTNINNIDPHDPHLSYGCTTCHDPHGVIGGTAAANRAMMNFDTAIVTTATTNFGYYYRGAGSKGCYLRCHNQNHNPETY